MTTQIVRDHHCFNCDHDWTAPVIYGETTSLSGEKTVWCPECGKRDGWSTPQYEMPIREVTEMKSLEQFITENNIRVVNCQWVSQNPNNPGWRDATHYKVTLKCRGGKQITTYFSMGLAHTQEPETDNILNCFALDSSGIENNPNFHDWCNEYGYELDRDSDEFGFKAEEAQTIYRACVTQAAKVKRWLGEEKYEELLWNVEGI